MEGVMELATLISFVIYFLLMLGIGVYFFARNKTMGDYFLGGRQLNSWVTALSAQASDMSGWLLMGLPAAAYMSGLNAAWIAVGLALGTYLNWRYIAAPLRKFTAVSGDSITIPQYLQNRFKSKSILIRCICAVIIAVFFLIYTASAFNAGAKLFQYVFGMDYLLALLLSSVIIIAYTFLGGFLAVCWTDFIQGLLMLGAIVVVPLVAVFSTPDFSIDTLSQVANGSYLNPFQTADGSMDIISIISNLAWALGYFGMPHILTRFMAIKSSKMIKKSRRIAMVWVVVSLGAAVLVGIFGYAYLTSIGVFYDSNSQAEIIFMDLVMKLIPPAFAGILLSAIMAAVMSTADSQLLVTASAISNDFYALFRKKASEKETMWVSRVAVLTIAVIAFVIAMDPENTVMGLVSYAWAGLGSAFGPVIVMSLFWKRMTVKGGLAGMIAGGATVLIWESTGLGTITGVYSIIPGFVLALILIVVVSKLDQEPSQEVYDLFDEAKKVEI
jgi:sodium/proline symporter